MQQGRPRLAAADLTARLVSASNFGVRCAGQAGLVCGRFSLTAPGQLWFEIFGLSDPPAWIANADGPRPRNNASVAAAGDEARHGKERKDPPRKPMKLPEARGLVDRILKGWLHSKAKAD